MCRGPPDQEHERKGCTEMFSTKRALAAVGVVAVAAIGLTSATGTAQAAVAVPRGCENVSYYSTWDGHAVFIAKPGWRYRAEGNKGENIYLTVSRGASVTTSLTKTWGTSAGVSIIGVTISAHSDISRQIQRTVTNTTTIEGSATVKTAHGHLQYGAVGYSYKWEAGYLNSACKAIITAKGTAMSPAHYPAIFYFPTL